MTRSLTALAALLLLAGGCEYTDDPNAPFGPMSEDDASHDLGEDPLDPVDDEDQPQGDDDDDDDDDGQPSGDDDDETDDGWDAAPPDWVADGTELHIELTCGLLDGLHRKMFEKQGGRWLEMDGDGNGPFEELIPCFVGGDEKFLTWDDTPEMYIFAGGLHHDITPTSVESRWSGEVYPESGTSSRECLDALAEWGMEWPVRMAITVTQVVPAP
jgi:hypothetical protein